MIDARTIQFSKKLENLFLNFVCLSFMFTTINFSIAFWVIRILIICFSFLYFLFNLNAKSKDILVFYLLIFMTLILCVFNQHALHCLLLLSTIILLKRVSLEMFIKTNLFYLFLTVFIILVLSLLGIIKPDYKIIKTGECINIYCFNNPNRMGSFLFSIVLFLSLFFSIKQHSFFANVIVIPLSFLIYERTGCRTAVIACFVQTLSYFLLLLFHRSKWMLGFVKNIISIMPLFLLFFTILFTTFANVGVFLALDLVLGRGMYLKPFLNAYSISALFTGVNFKTDAPFDNSYLYILLSTNIFIYFAFQRFCGIHIRKFNSSALIAYIPLILGLFAYGMTESLLGYYSYVSLLFFFLILRIPREVIR